MKGKNLSERVYKQILSDIMLGVFDNNEIFNEQTLADRYNCSRTPAREAAGRLVLEGFLNKYPSIGYNVRVPGEKEVSELRECRFALECIVIKKIIEEATDEQIKSLLNLPEGDFDSILYKNNVIFHSLMAQLTGNVKLHDMIEGLLYLLVRPIVSGRYPSYANYTASIQEDSEPVSKEHRALVEALLERNLEKATQILKDDIYPANK